ncbi:hypothetical protein DXG01_011506 [Tephrocybe rancida]|nr:hypothetical protein DXG01_011506 [Tephrocybe rancida]
MAFVPIPSPAVHPTANPSAPLPTPTICGCQIAPLQWYICNTPRGPQIVDVIRQYYASHPFMIYYRDVYGATPLDLAFHINNRYAVGTLQQLHKEMQNSAQPPPSPLERKLVDLLRLLKIQEDGYPMDELTLEFMQHRVQGMPDNLEDYIKQRKWGCTCGKCTDGWLSQRMRRHLSSTADDIIRRVPMCDDRPKSKIPIIEDTRAFFREYKIIVMTIRDLLRVPGYPLSKDSVITIARKTPDVDFHFSDGEFLMDVFHTLTHDVSKLLTQGTFSERLNGKMLTSGSGEIAYKALPKCNNDFDIALVRRRLGLPPDINDDGEEDNEEEDGDDRDESENSQDDNRKDSFEGIHGGDPGDRDDGSKDRCEGDGKDGKDDTGEDLDRLVSACTASRSEFIEELLALHRAGNLQV